MCQEFTENEKNNIRKKARGLQRNLWEIEFEARVKNCAIGLASIMMNSFLMLIGIMCVVIVLSIWKGIPFGLFIPFCILPTAAFIRDVFDIWRDKIDFSAIPKEDISVCEKVFNDFEKLCRARDNILKEIPDLADDRYFKELLDRSNTIRDNILRGSVNKETFRSINNIIAEFQWCKDNYIREKTERENEQRREQQRRQNKQQNTGKQGGGHFSGFGFDTSTSRFFHNCTTFSEVKREYRRLVKKYHPDVIGDNDMCAAINDEYRALENVFKTKKAV